MKNDSYMVKHKINERNVKIIKLCFKTIIHKNNYIFGTQKIEK
jgi:hypothetical protein